jgi:acyl-CoA dehydrogenase
MPFVDEWDEQGELPAVIRRRAYEAGIGGNWPAEFGGKGPQNSDIFHHIILNDELSRCGSGGLTAVSKSY